MGIRMLSSKSSHAFVSTRSFSLLIVLFSRTPRVSHIGHAPPVIACQLFNKQSTLCL